MLISEVLRNPKEYDWDEILDCYSRTKKRALIAYCNYKANNWDITQLMDNYNLRFESAVLLVFNVQQVLDGGPLANNIEEIYSFIQALDNDDDEIPDF